MAIEVLDLAELDPDAVQQNYALLLQLTEEYHPTLKLRGGVLADLLLYPSAQHAAAEELVLDRLQRSMSLQGIEEDPTLADDDIVDATLSNYLIDRRSGVNATGQVTVVLSRLASVIIPSGIIFEGDGKQFVTTAAYAARTASSQVQSDTDRLLQSLGNGNYAFTIPMTAVASGTASQITQGTALLPTTTIANFVEAKAAVDFAGGVDEETNAELVIRPAQGLAVQTMSGRDHMHALLAATFPSTLSSSIIGYGDAEMQRYHSIIPIAFGGRADWYVRTREQPLRQEFVLTATLLSKTTTNVGTWQITIDRDTYPGFYDVISVSPYSMTDFDGSLPITSQPRGLDLTAIRGELQPDITSVVEGAFTRYQSAVLQFTDSEELATGLSVGAERDYRVVLRGLPYVASIQTLAASRGNAYFGGDILVKAAVPCFLGISFTLEAKAGVVIPDPYEISDALAAYVNNLGFAGRLYGSAISDIIYNYLPARVGVADLDMLGQILNPDGSVTTIRSGSVLTIPNDPSGMVTSRTTVFYLEPSQVAISARTIDIPDA